MDQNNHLPQLPQCFPKASDDARNSLRFVASAQTLSPTYKLAFDDPEFLLRDELRPVRLQLELLKPELVMEEQAIEGTVVMFGGARLPDAETAGLRLAAAEEKARQNPGAESERQLAVARRVAAKTRYYEEARELARLVSETCLRHGNKRLVVATGGGPGIMEAANRGAAEAGAKSIGFNIVLPHEQAPNPYISPELCFQFHYFAIRKMHFLIRARALAVFPGGYGTMDELFETLTLIQTRKIKPMPVILFGREFWERAVDFEFLVAEGVISPADLDIFRYVETAAEAWQFIRSFYAGSSLSPDGSRC